MAIEIAAGCHSNTSGGSRPEKADWPLMTGSQPCPGHCACQTARKQFPSVNLALHSPLAHSHILSHTGSTMALPSCCLQMLGGASWPVGTHCACTHGGQRSVAHPWGAAPSPPCYGLHPPPPWLASTLSLINKVHFISDDASCSHPLLHNDAHTRHCVLSIYCSPGTLLNSLHTLLFH
jgi:hypothetical protein